MSGQIRKGRVKKVPLAAVKDDPSRYMREAEKAEIVITRHGKPAGVPIGFRSEDRRYRGPRHDNTWGRPEHHPPELITRVALAESQP